MSCFDGAGHHRWKLWFSALWVLPWIPLWAFPCYEFSHRSQTCWVPWVLPCNPHWFSLSNELGSWWEFQEIINIPLPHALPNLGLIWAWVSLSEKVRAISTLYLTTSQLFFLSLNINCLGLSEKRVIQKLISRLLTTTEDGCQCPTALVLNWSLLLKSLREKAKQQSRRVMSSIPGRCVKNKVICLLSCKNQF